MTVSHPIPEYNNPPIALFPHASSIADERPVYDAEYANRIQVRRMESNHRTVIVDAIVDELPHEVSFHALAMYTYLERHVNGDGKFSRSYQSIADDCNIVRHTAIALIAELAKHGYVRITKAKSKGGNNLPNQFFLPRHLQRTGDVRTSAETSAEIAPVDVRTGASTGAKIALKEVVSSSQEVVSSSAPDDKPKHNPIAKPSGPAQEIVAAWCKAMDIAQPANFGKALGNAAQLSKAGITAADIPDILAWLDRDKFWSGKGRDLGVILSQADKWRTSRKRVVDPNRNEDLVY